jgi:group I intron endonuclease
MKNVIYQIRCLANDAVYIGSARDFGRRVYMHLFQLRRGVHGNLYLQRAFAKYGEASFVFTVVAQVESAEQLIVTEQRQLDDARARGVRLMNICRTAGSMGGVFLGRRHTPKTIKRLREIAKARGNNGVHKLSAPETKQKISAKFKGIVWSKEIIEKRAVALREWWKTHEVSAETRAKIRAHKTAYWAARKAATKAQ